jgi:magnesium chelatase family protein
MLASVTSSAVLGIDAYKIQVEVDMAWGLQSFRTVGLPDGAVKEAQVRVKSALQNCRYEWPERHITVNLAPADVRKDGTGFDLPIAVGLMAASDQLPKEGPGWRLEEFLVLGELSLSGEVRAVRGALPVAICAREQGYKALILPAENAAEAGVVEGLTVLPVRHLREVVGFFRGETELAPLPTSDAPRRFEAASYPFDFAEVKGQEGARRALEVAAAGGHNVLMVGSPGAGKTMLARRIASILPEMSFEESLETTKIYSVTGLLEEGSGLVRHRPFRAPHHTISAVGLVGGGVGTPRPGELSLAHHGVLFLDELPEFQKRTLEVMRQPLEDQKVTLCRSMTSLTYPASVTLIASMNPCPCGYAGDPHHACRCTPQQVAQYRARISGPLLDRIDIHIEVPSVRYRELRETGRSEGSEAVKGRVEAARGRQRARFVGTGVHNNAQMRPRELERFCAVDEEGHRLLEVVVDRLGMSARSHARILKVARTIADLEGAEALTPTHLSEAIQYRILDREARP